MKSKAEFLRLPTEFSTYFNFLKICLSSVAFNKKELAVVKTLLSLKIPWKSVWEEKCQRRMQSTSLARDPNTAGNLDIYAVCDKNESNQ